MKIRIEDNSVRLRLKRSEVDQLAANGSLKSSTRFPENTFEYAVESSPDVTDLQAAYSKGCITVKVPERWIRNWPDSPKVGFGSQIELGGAVLDILVEKDFVCLDRNLADQTDQYPNPKQDAL